MGNSADIQAARCRGLYRLRWRLRLPAQRERLYGDESGQQDYRDLG